LEREGDATPIPVTWMAEATLDNEDDLSREFLAEMPARVAALEAARLLLAPAPAEGEAALRRLAHMLRGSAGSYGFPDLSVAAARAEDAPVPELDARVAELVAAVRKVVRRGRRRAADRRRRAARPPPSRPASDSTFAAPAEIGVPETGPAPVRVLIVEDDPAISRLLERALASPSRAVVVAPTAADANRLLAAGRFGLIILDLHLPDGDGRRLLADWRAVAGTRDVPIFVLSADVGPATKAECFAAGADACFDKPLRADVIVAAVAARLARAGLGPMPVTPTAAEPASVDRAGPAKVLVVEDDPLVASLVVHRLSRAGLAVRHVVDGAAAVSALSDRPDLMVLDLNLPELNGFQVLERMRERDGTRRTPVLILTASGAEDALVRAFALGADDYLVKPFSPTELLARVQRLLAGDSSAHRPTRSGD
jgi:DNA-binding response OmpR family regulator/HPt (histidine-containing phosphotransfer) domain-containing protein